MLMFPHSNCFRAFALSSRAFSQDYSWLRFPTGEVSHPPDSVFSHTSTGRPVESVSAPLSVRVLCWLESSHGDGIYTSGELVVIFLLLPPLSPLILPCCLCTSFTSQRLQHLLSHVIIASSTVNCLKSRTRSDSSISSIARTVPGPDLKHSKTNSY